jgi:hypothetical protein
VLRRGIIEPSAGREILWIVVALIMALVLLRSCAKDPEPAIVQQPAVILRDVAVRHDVLVPDTADRARIRTLLAARDSLRRELHQAHVRVIARIDTVIAWSHGVDTIRVACDEIRQTADVYIGRSPITLAPPRPTWAYYADVAMSRTLTTWIPQAELGALMHISDNATAYLAGCVPITTIGPEPQLRAGLRIEL